MQEFGMPRQSNIPYIRESLYFAWNVTGMQPKVQVSASVLMGQSHKLLRLVLLGL
jgi:hypothetical protein